MRSLDLVTLHGAAAHYASCFINNEGRFDQEWVRGQLQKLNYKDEFDVIVSAMRQILGVQRVGDFDAMRGQLPQRTDDMLEALLSDKLAIDPDGNHIPGKIGSSVVHGYRPVGVKTIEVEALDSIMRRHRLGLDKSHRETEMREVLDYWPIYAGEQEERAAGDPHGVCDPLPPDAPGMPVGALNTRIGMTEAIDMVDSCVARLEGGTGVPIVRGFTGGQPAGVANPATGTELFKAAYGSPSFPGAVSNTDRATATANPVAVVQAAETGLVGYCRNSSTNDGSTPLADHIDGEAGAAGADWNFTNPNLVSGGDVDITSHLLNVTLA